MKSGDYSLVLRLIFSNVVPTLEQAGYAGEQDLEAELKISDTGDHQVFFPRYHVLANLHVTGMLYTFKTLV
jgi:hypothetical protein